VQNLREEILQRPVQTQLSAEEKTNQFNRSVLFRQKNCPPDIAELVRVNIKTIAARLIWLAMLSREKNKQYLKAHLKQFGSIKEVQFDYLITFEHTQRKPLTVQIANGCHLVLEWLQFPLSGI